MIDEENRRELRETLAGRPSLRRLGELTRLATALEARGRSLPAQALLQFPRGTVLPAESLRGLGYELRGPWQNRDGSPLLDRDGGVFPDQVRLLFTDLVFRSRGLERFRPEDELAPTFEVLPRPGSNVKTLWVPGVELSWGGIVTVGTSGEPLSMAHVRFFGGSCLVSDYDGPVVVTFELRDPVPGGAP